MRLISAPLLYSTWNQCTSPIKSTIFSLIVIYRVFLFISCPNYSQEKSITRAFLFQFISAIIALFTLLISFISKVFFLAFQSIPIKILNGYWISPKTLFHCLVFLALTLPKISLRKVFLKVGLPQCYYQNTYAFSNPPVSYWMGSNSLLYFQRLEPLV